jgi:hypothetical protein
MSGRSQIDTRRDLDVLRNVDSRVDERLARADFLARIQRRESDGGREACPGCFNGQHRAPVHGVELLQ